MKHRIMVLAAATGLLIAPSISSSAVSASTRPNPLPAQAAPAGFVSTDAAGGGRIVYGRLNSPASEAAAFRAGLRSADAYFGRSLALIGAVRSTASGAPPAMLGLFRATLHGVPVGGLAVTAIDPRGGPRLMLLFDNQNRVRATLPVLVQMAQALGTGRAGSEMNHSAAGVSTMHTVHAPDGTVSVEIPSDWTVKRMSELDYVVTGPDDAAVYSLGVPVISPSGYGMPTMVRLAYVNDPVRAFVAVNQAQARLNGAPDPQIHVEKSWPLRVPPQLQHTGEVGAIITGTSMVKSVLRRFQGMIITGPPTQSGGLWNLRLGSFMSAPADRFKADLSTMMAIASSCRSDRQAYQAVVARSIAQINQNTQNMLQANADSMAHNRAIFESSMSSARAAQDSIDRSTSGFVDYLSDRAVVKNADTGEHSRWSAGTVQTLVNLDPHRFSTVPMNQYVKGVDY